MERVRTLIVGGGVAGLATAWALVREGARGVLLLEREPTFGTQSSGRNAAILRTFTGDAATTALALRTAEFLRQPPAGFAPVPLLDAVGLVLVPNPQQAEALAAWRVQKAPGMVAPLDRQALLAFAPGWRGATDDALLVRDEGRIDTAALLAGLADGARAGGAELRTGASVDGLLFEDGACRGVRLAEGESIRADSTVIASGGWAGRLAAPLASRVRMQPTRRHLLATAPLAKLDPRGPVLWSDPDAFYARPESGGVLLCACDESAADPDRCLADASILEAIAAKTARLLPALDDAGAANFWCGLRTFAPDREFVVGPDPDVPGLSWVAALGGHGMSTSIGLGELAARVLVNGAGDDPIAAALSPARLSPTLSASVPGDAVR